MQKPIARPMTIMLISVGIFFVIVFGFYGIKKAVISYYMSHYEPPAVTISSAKAISKTWQSYLTSVGSLSAINGVDLSSEVSGIVREVRFNSGQNVHKGDVIIVMDTSVEQAALKDGLAKLALAQINYDRDKKLFEKNVSSQAALDTRLAELKEAEAGVQSVQAQINQKTIMAPFDGRLGIRLVDIGQFVSAGTNMVTLQALNPLYVLFNLPEQYLPNLYIDQPVAVTINFGDGKTVSGKVTAINSKVDQVTRNILVQATIPNEDLSLFPGMFSLVKVWLKAENNTIVIPQTAISYSLSGDYVYLIKDESKDKDHPLLHVYRQYVKVGERREDVISIQDGLKEGDLVVSSGQLKLQNGTHVEINNSAEL